MNNCNNCNKSCGSEHRKRRGGTAPNRALDRLLYEIENSDHSRQRGRTELEMEITSLLDEYYYASIKYYDSTSKCNEALKEMVDIEEKIIDAVKFGIDEDDIDIDIGKDRPPKRRR